MKKTYLKLTERAALNDIDINPYKHYPPDMIRLVLEAFENGCTKEQVDKLVFEYQNGKIGESGLKKYINHPDINGYKKLLSAEQITGKSKDAKFIIKSYDMLFPETKSYGWSSSIKGMSVDFIKKFISDNDPDFKTLSPFLMAVDIYKAMRDKGYTYKESLIKANDLIGSNFELKINYAILEMLAIYIGMSGDTLNEELSDIADIISNFRISCIDFYNCMLLTASAHVFSTEGITNAENYMASHRNRIKYKIIETGSVFNKKSIAEPIVNKMNILSTILVSLKKGKSGAIDFLVSQNAGHDEFVMICTAGCIIDSVYDDIFSIDMEKRQYAGEIIKYIEGGNF